MEVWAGLVSTDGDIKEYCKVPVPPVTFTVEDPDFKHLEVAVVKEFITDCANNSKEIKSNKKGAIL